MVEAGWAKAFLRETDDFDVVRLELAGNDPLRARSFEDCTYTEVAVAWQNSRRHIEGVGYKIKPPKKKR